MDCYQRAVEIYTDMVMGKEGREGWSEGEVEGGWLNKGWDYYFLLKATPQ